MIEAGANEVTDAEMVGAIMYGHEEIKKVCAFIEEIQKEVGKPKREMELYHIPEDLDAAVKAYAYDKLVAALDTFDRQEREKETGGKPKRISLRTLRTFTRTDERSQGFHLLYREKYRPRQDFR